MIGLILWMCILISYLEDLLEEHIYPDDWYFVPSYGIKPSNSVQLKFDSLVVFLI